jgi:hypothetical protein
MALRPILLERVVDVGEDSGEQLVVVAELEELRVGVLEQLNGGLRAVVRVQEKRRVPADDREVGVVVRDARLQHLGALARREPLPVAAHDLRNLEAVIAHHVGSGLGGGLRRLFIAHVEDEVVFAEPARVGTDERVRVAGDGAVEALAHDRLHARRKIHVPNPAAGQLHQALPVARERKLVDDADHAVVVVLDLALENLFLGAFAAAQNERIERTDDRRPLIAHVGRHRVLDLGLLYGARVHRLLQLVEAQLFADVELNQDQNRSAQRSLSRCFHSGCHRSTPISSLLRPFVKG